jgi:hypothetical protein
MTQSRRVLDALVPAIRSEASPIEVGDPTIFGKKLIPAVHTMKKRKYKKGKQNVRLESSAASSIIQGSPVWNRHDEESQIKNTSCYSKPHRHNTQKYRSWTFLTKHAECPDIDSVNLELNHQLALIR